MISAIVSNLILNRFLAVYAPYIVAKVCAKISDIIRPKTPNVLVKKGARIKTARKVIRPVFRVIFVSPIPLNRLGKFRYPMPTKKFRALYAER